MAKIGLIDYGMGNIHSVVKSIEDLEEEVLVVNKNTQFDECKALVIPGQGAFDPAIDNLLKTGLIDHLKDWVKKGNSFLGICLGLQLLFESSDEGNCQGLGIIKGHIKMFFLLKATGTVCATVLVVVVRCRIRWFKTV